MKLTIHNENFEPLTIDRDCLVLQLVGLGAICQHERASLDPVIGHVYDFLEVLRLMAADKGNPAHAAEYHRLFAELETDCKFYYKGKKTLENLRGNL